jgi:hypothetical protein
MTKLPDSGLTQPAPIPGEICRSKFDPGAPEGRSVVHDVSGDVFESEIGELDAERAPVAKRNQQNWVRQPKVPFDDVAVEHVPEERGKSVASFRPHEQMDPRPKRRETTSILCHWSIFGRGDLLGTQRSGRVSSVESRLIGSRAFDPAPLDGTLVR